MDLAAAALFTLQIAGLIATPIYLRARGLMSLNTHAKLSNKKLIKDISLHFTMMFGITVFFIVMLFSFLNNSAASSQNLLFYISLEVVFLAAALYGSGMYIASILIDTFVKSNLKIVRLVHGPVSHGIMFGAYLCAFGNLGNIAAHSTNPAISIPWYLFLTVGLLGGYSAAISAISGGISYLYALESTIIGIIFLAWNFNLLNPFVQHFIGFSVSSAMVCLAYILIRIKQNEPLAWYHPINVSKIKFNL